MSRDFRSRLMPPRVRCSTEKSRVQLALTRILKIMLNSLRPRETNRIFLKREKIRRLTLLEAQKLLIDRLVPAQANGLSGKART